jgi:hypothetical protein
MPKGAIRSDIPTEVDVPQQKDQNQPDDDHYTSKKLEFGVSTPGTMAKMSSYCLSPLSVLDVFSQKSLFPQTPSPTADTKLTEVTVTTVDETTTSSPSKDDEDQSTRLGIYSFPVTAATSPFSPEAQLLRRRDYNHEDDTDLDDETVYSVTDYRLGIEPANYITIQEESLLDALGLCTQVFSKRKKQRRTKQDNGDEDSDALWQLRFQQPESLLASTDLPPEDHQDWFPHDDVPGRLLHTPTAQGHYLVNSRPLDAPLYGLKYSLTQGNKDWTRLERSASQRQTTRPNVVFGSTQEGALKIFCLLLNPKAKIFELIQILYHASDTTVQDLINLIPHHATEPALASQVYVGLCRPKDGTDLPLHKMASTGDSCKIVRGEVLVAIPHHYTGPQCAKLAQTILQHERVQKLMKQSDPLAPSSKRRAKKHRHSSRRSSRHSSSRQHNKIETSMLDAPGDLWETNMSFGSMASTNLDTSLHSTQSQQELYQSLQQSLESNNVEAAKEAFGRLLQGMSSPTIPE